MRKKQINHIWIVVSATLIIFKLFSTVGFSTYLRNTLILSSSRAAPIAQTSCGFHGAPCCPQMSVGSYCQDGSTCMPNMYCVFPVGTTIVPTNPPTLSQSLSPVVQAPSPTPNLAFSPIPSSPTPTTPPLPTGNTQNTCGNNYEPCCDPVKLIFDPLQSQAITSQSGYCYSPYRCTRGLCGSSAGTSSSSQPPLTISLPPGSQATIDSAPPLIKRIAHDSIASTVQKITRFRLTKDVKLPLCPYDLRQLPQNQHECAVVLEQL